VTNRETSRRPFRTTRPYVLWGLVAAILVGGVAAWWRHQLHTLDEPRFPFSTIYPDLERVAKATGIRFPPTAKLVRATYYIILAGEYYLYATVELRPDEAAVLLRNVPSPKKVYTGDSAPEEIKFALIEHPPSLDWWHPSSTTEFIIAVSTARPGTRISILLMQDDPSLTIAYIALHRG